MNISSLIVCLIFTEHANQIHTEELSDRNSIRKIKKTTWKFLKQAKSEVEEFMNELNYEKVPPITFEVCEWF